MTDQSSRRLFTTLDALRGVAAIIVVIIHTHILFSDIDLPNGRLAVDFFFVLSGFVISYSYGNKIDRSITKSQFIVKRFSRLFPMYALGCAIGLTALLLNYFCGPTDGFAKTNLPLAFVIALFTNSLFLPTPVRILTFASHYFPFNFPAWSLFFEFFINIVYCFIAKLLSIRKIILVALLSGVCLFIAAMHYGSVDIGWKSANFLGGFPRIAFSFFAGILVFKVWAHKSLQRVPPNLVVVALCIMLLMPDLKSLELTYQLIAVTIIFPIIVYLGACASGEGKLEAKAFSLLGVASYPIYVLHVPILMLIIFVNEHFAKSLISSCTPFIGVAFLLALVYVSQTLDLRFDRPIRKMLEKQLNAALKTIRPSGKHNDAL